MSLLTFRIGLVSGCVNLDLVGNDTKYTIRIIEKEVSVVRGGENEGYDC